MYNGQYVKGAFHLVIFVLLLSLADNLSNNLYWLVWGWVFYQAFDAYHTARARRDGQPLPNPFGWNDLGERFNFHRPSSTPPASPWAPPVSSSVGTDSSADTSVVASGNADYSPIPDWSQYPPQDWYQGRYQDQKQDRRDAASPLATPQTSENPYADVPPAGVPDRANGPLPFPASHSTASATAPGMQIPYRPTFTGPAPGLSPLPVSGIQRFPAGALWLIGLGLLFLLGNLQPAWSLSGRWLVPSLLAFVGIWSGLRRWDQLYNARGIPPALLTFAGALVGPILLVSVAALLALDGAHILAMRRSWPLLLIIWGCLLAIQRSSASNTVQGDLAHVAAAEGAAQTAPRTGTFGL